MKQTQIQKTQTGKAQNQQRQERENESRRDHAVLQKNPANPGQRAEEHRGRISDQGKGSPSQKKE